MLQLAVDEAVELGDITRVDELLKGATARQLDEARTWYAKQGRRTATALAVSGEQIDRDHAGVAQLLAAHLAPKATDVAKALAPQSKGRVATDAVEPLLIRTLAKQGADWCLELLTAVAARRGRVTDRDAALVRVLLPLIARFELTLPATPTFAKLWTTFLLHAGRPESIDGAELPRLTRLYRIDQRGVVRAGVRLDSDMTMSELLAATPFALEGIGVALAVPNAIAALASTDPRRRLSVALGTLVSEGRLDRGTLVTACLDTLDRRDNVASQRIVADTFAALELSPADIASRHPMAIAALTAAHTSVAGVLLPALLTSVLDEDELLAVCRTVLDRGDLRLSRRVLAALTAKDAVRTFGEDAVLAALGLAAASADARIAQKAADALGAFAPSASAITVDAGLWDRRPEPPAEKRLPPIDPTIDGLSIIRFDMETSPTRTTEALFMATLVEAAAADAGAVIRWLHEHDLLHKWTRQGSDRLHESAPRIAQESFSSFDQYSTNRHPTSAMLKLMRLEVAARLGSTGPLLSTPTFEDGTLDFDDLLARLRRFDTNAYSPVDLLQAMLRLRPVDPVRVGELNGLWQLPERPDTREIGKRPEDGLQLIADWIRGGGAHAPRAVVRGAAMEVPPIEFPFAITRFGHAPRMLMELQPGRDRQQQPAGARPMWSRGLHEGMAAVLPYAPELLAVELESDLPEAQWGTAEWAPQLALSGDAGPGLYSLIAHAIGHDSAESRDAGIAAVTTLIARNAFDPIVFGHMLLRAVHYDSISLARTVPAFEKVIEAGGLASLWPTLMMLTDVAVAPTAVPAGGLELLAIVRRYAPAVPETVAVASDPLREFAGRRVTKAVTEARGYVELVDGRTRAASAAASASAEQDAAASAAGANGATTTDGAAPAKPKRRAPRLPRRKKPATDAADAGQDDPDAAGDDAALEPAGVAS